MARITNSLRDTPIKANTPKDKDCALFEGGARYLLVKSNGSKIWRFKYTRPYTQKGALISFGSDPEISLQQVRKQRGQSSNLITQDIDPHEYKTEQKQRKQMELNNTFYAISERWFKFKTVQGSEEVTLKKPWRSLENHVFP